MPMGKSGFYAKSEVCVADADGANERVVFSTTDHLEAPNWSPDGSYLLVNSGGQLYSIPVHGESRLDHFPTGSLVSGVNNDHGISPDGKRIAISAGVIYSMIIGEDPVRIADKAPSYFHAWSPDGGKITYCAQRDGVFCLFEVPSERDPLVKTDAEIQLTFSGGFDDGPDYSPDGRWIYFNSNRSGTWCIWRIPATGSGGPGDPLAEQITSGHDGEDWFPHPSPDGKWIVFLSFPPGTAGHPAGLDIEIRRIPMPDPDSYAGPVADIQTLLRFFGGQGTFNVPSWSPDSKQFAYVKYARMR